MKPELLTTGEAARLCQVSARTIARWADAGVVPSHRTVGGRRRIARDDLLTFMKGRGMLHANATLELKRSALIVEDDPLVAAALERTIRWAEPGCVVETANNGFAAGTLLTSLRPDVVLLDLVMPGLSGLEVCRYIRGNPRFASTSVFIVSGCLDDGLREELLRVGATHCIDKPFDRQDLAALLRAELHRAPEAIAV